MEQNSEIETLMKINHNQKCNDCEAPSKWVSVNNAVFLCIKCAGVHRTLGSHISIIKSLNMDILTETELGVLKKGGNLRFNQLLGIYSISPTTPIEKKYATKAVNYYRQLLLAEYTNAEKQPTMPDEEEGLKLLDAFESPEVTNEVTNETKVTNETSTGTTESKSDEKKDEEVQTQSNEGGILNSMGNFFGAVKEGAQITASNFTHKVSELGTSLSTKVGELGISEKINSANQKIYEMGESCINKTKEFGGNFVDKSYEVGGNIVEGTKSLGTSIVTKTNELNKVIVDKGNEVLSSEYVQVPKKYTEESIHSFSDKAKQFFGYKTEQTETKVGESKTTEIKVDSKTTDTKVDEANTETKDVVVEDIKIPSTSTNEEKK